MNRFRRISWQRMSLWESVSELRGLLSLMLLLIVLCSCEKEVEYVYKVNEVQVQSGVNGKTNAKSTTEFITIAWADLFGTAISQQKLAQFNTVYLAFGDKQLVEDRILLNMLNEPNLQIPVQPSVNGDTMQFIADSYQQLYNRAPNAFEAYYLKEQIRLNPALTPRVLWYALMTSDEYRYY